MKSEAKIGVANEQKKTAAATRKSSSIQSEKTATSSRGSNAPRAKSATARARAISSVFSVIAAARPANLPRTYSQRAVGVDSVTCTVRRSMSRNSIPTPTKSVISRPKTLIAERPTSFMIFASSPTVSSVR